MQIHESFFYFSGYIYSPLEHVQSLVQGLSPTPLDRVNAQVVLEERKFTSPSQQLQSAGNKRPFDWEKGARSHLDMTEKGPGKAEQSPVIGSHLCLPPSFCASAELGSQVGKEGGKGLPALNPALGGDPYSTPTEITAADRILRLPRMGAMGANTAQAPYLPTQRTMRLEGAFRPDIPPR